MQDLTTEFMPEELVDAFGGEDKILALPRYKIDDSNFGQFRDYPDFIDYDDLTSPIMIGVDKYRRTFIAFKFKFVSPTTTLKLTEVLFQRYTDSEFWTSASNPCGVYSIMGEGGMRQEHYNNLQKVLIDGIVKNVYNSYTRVTGDYVLG